MSHQAAAKLSVSVPFELAQTVRKRVGSRGLSSFVARAIQHELEREQLGAFLDEMKAELGPLPKKVIDQARAAWPKR
jgi:hypothetical protein